LDRRLELPPGFNRQYLLKAMQGHVLATGELTGKFDKDLPDAPHAKTE
jgi:phosphatidylethanolamine-binding protein (PEBP) family uncharacterized protein